MVLAWKIQWPACDTFFCQRLKYMYVSKGGSRLLEATHMYWIGVKSHSLKHFLDS